MTVIVSVKINDGIVMASDSASTFTNTQVYDHAEKIVNLIRDLPIGVMVTGDAGIGSESLTTLLKDLGKWDDEGQMERKVSNLFFSGYEEGAGFRSF